MTNTQEAPNIHFIRNMYLLSGSYILNMVQVLRLQQGTKQSSSHHRTQSLVRDINACGHFGNVVYHSSWGVNRAQEPYSNEKF